MTSGALNDPQVNQAAGMISVQAECTVPEALVLLQDRALVSGQSIHDIARDTIERRIRFGLSA